MILPNTQRIGARKMPGQLLRKFLEMFLLEMRLDILVAVPDLVDGEFVLYVKCHISTCVEIKVPLGTSVKARTIFNVLYRLVQLLAVRFFAVGLFLDGFEEGLDRSCGSGLRYGD